MISGIAGQTTIHPDATIKNNHILLRIHEFDRRPNTTLK